MMIMHSSHLSQGQHSTNHVTNRCSADQFDHWAVWSPPGSMWHIPWSLWWWCTHLTSSRVNIAWPAWSLCQVTNPQQFSWVHHHTVYGLCNVDPVGGQMSASSSGCSWFMPYWSWGKSYNVMITNIMLMMHSSDLPKCQHGTDHISPRCPAVELDHRNVWPSPGSTLHRP